MYRDRSNMLCPNGPPKFRRVQGIGATRSFPDTNKTDKKLAWACCTTGAESPHEGDLREGVKSRRPTHRRRLQNLRVWETRSIDHRMPDHRTKDPSQSRSSRYR